MQTEPPTYFRKVIRIAAEDSPNVKRGLAMEAAGLVPDGKTVIEGPLSWTEYKIRLKTWDKRRVKIGIKAQFDESPDSLLFPTEWLEVAQRRHGELSLDPAPRRGKAIGCDPAEGGDDTSWTVVDDLGVLEVVSEKTPNTTVIPNKTIELGKKWGVPSDAWVFDRGGGKQHVDRLRQMGHNVKSVSFGEAVEKEIKPGTQKKTFRDRRTALDDKHLYANRRAQMYFEASLLLCPDPIFDEEGNSHEAPLFGIPNSAGAGELVRQLALIPKYARLGNTEWSMWDSEDRIRMLPKKRKSGRTGEEGEVIELCLADLIGCSPDEADSFVLAVYGLLHCKPKKFFMR